MFFRRKQQNRRLGRDYVLDVRLRSSQVKAARSRFMGISAAVLFGLAAVIFIAWRVGGWALDTLAYENPAFNLTSLEIQTDGVISTEQLRQWAKVKVGDNLLALDLAQVKKNLETLPWIQSVSVERILPHHLRLRISEREPIAQVNIHRQRPTGEWQQLAFQTDFEGWLMLPLTQQQRGVPINPAAEQLPVITGIKLNDPQPGRRLDSTQARAALNLVSIFDHSQMAGFMELKKVDASAPDVLTVTTGQGGEITFGMSDVDQQIRRWHDIQEMGQRMGKAIHTLDLGVTNNIPAQWVDASSVPPVPPKLPKPWRSKKKHV
jgi:hypothetical protein